MIFFSSDADFEKFYQTLSKHGEEISLLVTESPKLAGRKKIIAKNAAHRFAKSVNLSAISPDHLAEKDVNNEISVALKGDRDKFGFIFSYGKIIPKSLIDHFEKGILNIHFSLLPEYPGASPIQQAILDGKEETGYTIFKISEKLDQGDVLVQKKIKVKTDDNFDSLRGRIIEDVLVDLPKILDEYRQNKLKVKKIIGKIGRFTKKIAKSDGQITKDDTAQSTFSKIKAFSRWPKAFMIIENKRIIIHSARISGNLLQIELIQLEGKKPISFKDFANGHAQLLTKMPVFVKVD